MTWTPLGDENSGYTGNTLRRDGKLMTVFCWQEGKKVERDITAMIWMPPPCTRAVTS